MGETMQTDKAAASIAKLDKFMTEWDREVAAIKANMDKRIAARMPDSKREKTK